MRRTKYKLKSIKKNVQADVQKRAVFALLSFIPGIGHLFRGKVKKGIGWFMAVTVGYLLFLVPGVILHLMCIKSLKHNNTLMDRL